jgi:hypothetical protein
MKSQTKKPHLESNVPHRPVMSSIAKNWIYVVELVDFTTMRFVPAIVFLFIAFDACSSPKI